MNADEKTLETLHDLPIWVISSYNSASKQVYYYLKHGGGWLRPENPIGVIFMGTFTEVLTKFHEIRHSRASDWKRSVIIHPMYCVGCSSDTGERCKDEI